MGGGGSSFTPAPSAAMPPNLGAPLGSGLGDLFDLTGGVGTLSGSYVAPKTVSGVVRGAETPLCLLHAAGCPKGVEDERSFRDMEQGK